MKQYDLYRFDRAASRGDASGAGGGGAPRRAPSGARGARRRSSSPGGQRHPARTAPPPPSPGRAGAARGHDRTPAPPQPGPIGNPVPVQPAPIADAGPGPAGAIANPVPGQPGPMARPPSRAHEANPARGAQHRRGPRPRIRPRATPGPGQPASPRVGHARRRDAACSGALPGPLLPARAPGTPGTPHRPGAPGKPGARRWQRRKLIPGAGAAARTLARPAPSPSRTTAGTRERPGRGTCLRRNRPRGRAAGRQGRPGHRGLACRCASGQAHTSADAAIPGVPHVVMPPARHAHARRPVSRLRPAHPARRVAPPKAQPQHAAPPAPGGSAAAQQEAAPDRTASARPAPDPAQTPQVIIPAATATASRAGSAR